MASPMQLVSLSRRERNSNINVGSFSPNNKYSDKSRWICIYPCYLNSKRTVSEGRQVSLKYAVENPTLNEIKDVLVSAGFQVELEVNKVHPRELNKYENLSRGRIRVHLKKDDGSPMLSNFINRDSVLIYVAETIPKLKTRGATTAKSSSTSQAQANAPTTSKKSNKKK